MKYQDLFSLKNKKKKNLECRLLQILLGALRVKVVSSRSVYPTTLFWVGLVLYALSQYLIVHIRFPETEHCSSFNQRKRVCVCWGGGGGGGGGGRG